MDKTKISTKRKTSSKNISKYELKPERKHELKEYKVGEIVLKKGFLAKAITECLMNNDPEGVIEVIRIYIDLFNKSQLAKKSGMQRSTIYQAIKGKNPTIKTITSLLHSIEATK